MRILSAIASGMQNVFCFPATLVTVQEALVTAIIEALLAILFILVGAYIAGFIFLAAAICNLLSLIVWYCS